MIILVCATYAENMNYKKKHITKYYIIEAIFFQENTLALEQQTSP